MRKNIIGLMFLLLLTCCKNHNNDLDENLNKVILNYQKKYPIPELNDNKTTNEIYIYKVYFWKEQKDTVIVIQRSSAGISESDKGYGIYQNNNLHPTFIYDDKALGNKFIINKINDIENRKKFYWIKRGSPPENFPPVYKYKVKNTSLNLVKIDTVWTKWD